MTIEKLNRQLRQCKECGLSLTRSNVICGEGNPHAHLMLVAQAPGEHEDIKNRMFIGPSGHILNRFLANGGIKKEDIYMTNLVKCNLPGNRKPKKVEIDLCCRYLEKEIELVNPSVIATMGYYAARYIFRKYDIDFPESKGNVPEIFGKLFHAGSMNLYPMGHTAVILYHPALETGMEKHYRRLYVLSRRCKWYDVCPMKYFSENGVIDEKWTAYYCNGDWESCARYWKEENGEYHPDEMLPDGSIMKNRDGGFLN